MVAIVVLVLVVPALGTSLVLLQVTPGVLLVAAPIGIAGAALVEVAERVASAVGERRGATRQRASTTSASPGTPWVTSTASPDRDRTV